MIRGPDSVFLFRRCPVLLVILATAVFLECSSGAPLRAQAKVNPKATTERQPLPLDPLTSADRALAERIATEDSRVRELIGTGPHHLVSVDLLFLKPEKEESPAPVQAVEIDRNAEVIFRREDESGVRAIVNLTKRTVTFVSRIESRQIPLTQEDIVEAARLAVENEELRHELGTEQEGFAAAAKSSRGATGRYAVTGLRLFTQDEDDPCYKHRCVRLMFRRDQDYLVQPVVMVDLTTRQVNLERRDQ
jgi:Cu2+-containing amine oxidase